jgi:3,4-dihydroxy 2-butanone 4-phosphate synthase/GTP cyclohydrolase II
MAGLFPAGVICEVMNPDGTMARRPQLLRFARRHKLTLLSVADLVRYRLQYERLVRRIARRKIHRADSGTFEAIAYSSEVDASTHVALVKGDVANATEPVLTRVHRACLAGELLGSTECDCGWQLQQAFRRIGDEGCGVIVYLNRELPATAKLQCTHRYRDDQPEHHDRTRLREFGLGAQILKDLGLSRLRLLTNNPKKIVGLESYNLEIDEQIPLVVAGDSERESPQVTPLRVKG